MDILNLPKFNILSIRENEFHFLIQVVTNPPPRREAKLHRRLLFYVEKQSLKRRFVSISDDVGLNEKTVRNIFRDYINRVKETLRFETPDWLGIDEIHFIKPRCVLTNMEVRTLLDVLPNRNKETIVDILSRLTSKGRSPP
jgi:transposase